MPPDLMPPDLMHAEQLLTDARLVLPDRVLRGSLAMAGGRITAIDAGPSRTAGAEPLEGDLLLPGLIDLHTDNLERQVQPRPTARWPSVSAYLAHDAQLAAAGITTVLDALCVGDLGYEAGRVQTLRDGLRDGAALARAGLLRVAHFLHLRCELAAPDMQALFDLAGAEDGVRLISLMDHTPGGGQYADLDRFRALRRADPMEADAVEALIGRLQAGQARHLAPNRDFVLAAAQARGVAVASHDDSSAADIAANHARGVSIAEFPVRLEAAQAAKRLRMPVIAGAPNLVRGGSHSGNVGVAALLAAGCVDALASDYVPASLLEAALQQRDPAGLAEAVARVSRVPARIAGLEDRGEIRVGLRADLVRVHLPAEASLPPVVRAVWRGGSRIG